MSAYWVWNGLSLGSLVVRWTALLALAWVGNRALAGRNPRWRVVLWRAAVAGIAGVGILTLAPPVITVPVVPAALAVAGASAEATTAPRLRQPGPGTIAPTPRQPDFRFTAPVDLASIAQPAAPAWQIVPTLLAAWGVGVALLAARLALAWYGLVRIIRGSDEAPGRIVGQCRDVAEAIGAPAVRVVFSAEVATPCLAGLWRPVLLLPARALGDDDLRAVLAHELAHARGHDLAWNFVAHLTTIVLWFHPLAWRIRLAHAAACDAVCDAVAADFLGDVRTYARTLARMALVNVAPPPAPGLAMARSSNVGRRVDALNRKVFRSSLPRRLAVPAVCAGGVLFFLIGGLAVTDAMPQTSSKSSALAQAAAESSDSAATPAADGRLEIRAVAAASGKAIEGATVEWRLRINQGRYKKTTSSTGADGKAVLEWPRGATVNGLELAARKPGFVPYTIRWDDRAHPLRPPAAKVLRLVSGVSIGGVVKDEAGQPVAGAKITVNAPPTETEASYYSIQIAEIRTDGAGRWRFDDAPTDFTRMNVNVEAPRFLRGGGPPSRDLDSVTVLRRGFTLRGRVVDNREKPVAGARIIVGDNRSSEPKPGTTDARGEFVMENCPPGPSLVTVRAEGFAPELRAVHPEDTPSLQFRLGPGHTLRGKVVDRQGRPIPGAMVAADTWREHRSLDFRVDTDRDGQFEWRSAPEDAVLYDFVKTGCMARRRVALTTSASEQVITLDPELTISGGVTDAATGRPVPAFRAVGGLVFSNSPRVAWLVQDAVEFTGGRYIVKHSEPYAGYAVRVEASGYKTAESRVFRPGEGELSFDFALDRAAAADLLTGLVLGPEGLPAAGAEIALATRDHPLIFEMEQVKFGRGNGMSFAKTGPDGRFTFDAPGGPFLVAAISDDGYAEATDTAFTRTRVLAMHAWGKIKGQALVGRKPAADQIITVSRRHYQPSVDGVNAFYGINTRTDAQGRFSFDRVIPGESEVSRVVVTEFGNGSSQHMGCWQEPVDVAPGATVEVKIGGKGRPVIGRVALEAPPGVHVDWRQNRPATIEKARVFNPLQGLFGQDPRQFDRFAASLDKDGRFRVDDVPPGHYELTVTIDAPPALDRPGAVQERGRVKVPVDVPAGDGDAPIDLGEIAATVKGR